MVAQTVPQSMYWLSGSAEEAMQHLSTVQHPSERQPLARERLSPLPVLVPEQTPQPEPVAAKGAPKVQKMWADCLFFG